MSFQAVFKRYEIKYIITRRQKEALIEALSGYMVPDKYGHTSIRSIYYDTDSCLLARRSEEKPVYKEKLRVRSYGRADPESAVFVELKKKYESVVYKRRITLSESAAEDWLIYGEPPRGHTQIEAEIEYFRQFYKTLYPKMFISCERDALCDKAGRGFRATFDENILARADRLSLCENVGGMPLLEPDRVLMEIKIPEAVPLWFTSFLTENKIYKTSFSKYGTAYNRLIMTEKGEQQYVC